MDQKRRRSALILFQCLMLTIMGAGSAMAAATVTKARIGMHAEKTRFVLELTRAVPYRVFLLAKPYRVVIDLPAVEWRAASPRRQTNSKLIAKYRFGLFRPENSRVVIDLTGPATVTRHAILNPTNGGGYRFFIDLKPTPGEPGRVGVVATRNWVAAKPAPRSARPVEKHANGGGRRIVMLDPGHGGVDPGAIGARGTFESRITLNVAKAVKRKLEATGRYRVLLTRYRDIYIPLRDRFDRAEASNAQIFISLHADTIKNRKIRGASVYTLSENASDAEAGALAAKENRSDIIAGVDLTAQSDTVASVLISLRQRDTMQESAHFARFLVKSLGKAIGLLRNTHRFAGFAVLKSPDVPSVLVELGYLSNRRDEKMLRSADFRQRVGRAVLEAADRYFARKERLNRS